MLNVASGVGLPLKIDPLSISLYHGMYTRVLVDMDMLKPLTEKITAKLFDVEYSLDVSFFAPVTYETLPTYYTSCDAFTHLT